MKGYVTPALTDLCIQAKNYFHAENIDLDEVLMSKIYTTLAEKEKRIFPVSLNQDQGYKVWRVKQRDEEIDGNLAIAFCEFIGGALLCIIPHPAVQAVGVALVSDSAVRAFNGLSDKDKKKLKQEEAFRENVRGLRGRGQIVK
jgi:hypothetical protein